MTQVLYLTGAALIAVAAAFLLLIRSRHLHLWLRAYVRRLMDGPPALEKGPVHLFVCFVDHFEPVGGTSDLETQRHRMDAWLTRYPPLARKHCDWGGRTRQHTFFYPAEEYRSEYLDQIREMCQSGIGDVEVHLHHDGDTAENFRKTITEFAARLHEQHGFLRVDSELGRPSYGFIHGNWALNNSRPDGRWCGVDDETSILLETGCYADFTFPSAPSATQPSTINKIYYARPGTHRKAHDRGTEAEVGREPPADGLLMVQGPLTLNWSSRKWGLLPRIENGEISGDAPPTPDRVDLWVRQHIHVKGKPNWVFIKLHTHGAQEQNIEAVLGEPSDTAMSYLESRYNDGVNYRLHYVTARETYELIKAAEAGCVDDPAALGILKTQPVGEGDSQSKTGDLGSR